MRTTPNLLILLFLLLGGLTQVRSEAPAPVDPPPAVQIPVQPGLNALAITRFPFSEDGAGLAQRLTLASVFGEKNEAGLIPGNSRTADLIWVFVDQQWLKFFYVGEGAGPLNIPPGWKAVGQGLEDMSQFAWPYTTGVLIERQQEKPGVITLQGESKNTPSFVPIHQGPNFVNRIYEGHLTLADLRLESFFVRLPDELLADLPMTPSPPGSLTNPDGGGFKADRFIDPVANTSYILLESGTWFEINAREPVDPNTVNVPGTYGVNRIDRSIEFTINPPPPSLALVQLQRPPPVLGLEEGNVRRLLGRGFGPPECTCAILFQEDDRPITLHIIETGTAHAIVRVGKHPDNVTTKTIAVVSGQGVIGPLVNPVRFFAMEQAVRSFFSEQPIPDPVPFQARLRNPERRDGERRFFSEFTAEGNLVLHLTGVNTWVADTLLEADFVAATPDNRKIALHLPQFRLLQDTPALAFANQLAALLEQALVERNLVPAAQLQIDVTELPGGEGVTLSFSFGLPLLLGKADLCALPPVTPPVIQSTSTVVATNGLIQIRGQEFGKRIEDVCMVLTPANGEGRSIPLRPVALESDGTSIIARVVGQIANGQPLRVMMTKGIGRTRPIDMGFPDVFQRQGIWVWRGIGVSATSSPNTLTPALGQSEPAYFHGDLVDGSLEITLDQPWPENAEVSISFTANTETVQLDAYAPDLCFSVSGSTEDCAKRIQRVLKAAFVQGGMASANQVQVQRSVNGDEITFTVDIFTDDGVRSPITNGHLNISVGEENTPCTPPSPEDSDGDLMQDSWELAQFLDLELAEIHADADPDNDGIPNHVEFALNSDPQLPNNAPALQISLDDEEHPLMSFERHVAATNFYNFDIETSMDGDHWERLANLELLNIIPIGGLGETVIARCLVDAHLLGASFYRLQVTPKS